MLSKFAPLLFDQCIRPADLDNDQPQRASNNDPGAPYYITDLYPRDLDNPATPQIEDPPWEKAFEQNEHLVGGIVKLYDDYAFVGGYGDAFQQWGVRNLREILKLGRLGGGYTFTRVTFDWRKTIEAFARLLEASGWPTYSNGIIPAIDLEECPENNAASAQEIIDHVSHQAEWLKARLARRVMLYGRGIMRDKRIKSRMGCDALWNPSYTKLIVLNGALVLENPHEETDWTWDTMPLWQAIGDGNGENSVNHVPYEVRGFGRVDLSVVIDGNKAVTWDRVTSALL